MGGADLFGGQHGPQPMSEINTTPLVDVMLVLLVIFIITAPLLTHAVKIDLPQASSVPLEEKPEVIDIAIDAEGVMYWNDVKLVEGELQKKLQLEHAKSQLPEIQIRADKNSRYQVIAALMADAQKAGLTKIGFVSQPE